MKDMVEQVRPKIILVYGVHLNEKEATQELANKLKPLLEARGFDVQIVEFPEDKTLHELIKKCKTSEEIDEVITSGAYMTGEQWLKQFNNAADLVLDLHCTSNQNYKDVNILRNPEIYELRKPKFWSARVTDPTNRKADPKNPLFIKNKKTPENNNAFVLEFPARYKQARQEWRDIIINRIGPIRGMFVGDYFYREVDLPATKNAGYLSPLTIAKFTHLIDTEVKTRLGIYHAPKTPPFKPKRYKYSSIDIERERLAKEDKAREIRFRLLRERIRRL